jgi:hypothetical protein
MVGAQIRVEDDGTILYLDADGRPLTDYLTNLAKRQHGDKIREMLQDIASRINGETEALGTLHHHTPRPDDLAMYQSQTFEKEEPLRPYPRKISLGARLLGKRARIEAEDAELFRRYEADMALWKAEKESFEAKQVEQARRFNTGLRSDVEFMQEFLEGNLASIVWPRETLVSFEVADEGKSVAIDVDLPEIEDMQRKTASVPDRGYKLTLKEVKGKALQELYSRHVHSVGFRIVGEVFASLPTVEEVTLSAYTQRTLPTTGHPVDTYVYSLRVPRAEWAKINFANLPALDVVAAFERFELRRKFGKSGQMEGIEPLGVSVSSRG